MLRLWKRTPGTPLSPAERRQRQEAAEASADKRRGQGNAGRASLDMFRAEIRNIPVLSAEQERDLTTRWARDRDAKARDQILTAHLRMSFAGARKLAGYGLPLDDLVAAGNIGLIQAIDRYDPGHNANARFATFASTYVRAAQLRHVLDNWSIVRMGTNRDQKRLFFSLREDLRQIDQNGSADAAEVIAARRGVKASAVRDMAARFTGRDTSLNTPMGDEADGDEWVDRLVGGGEHAEATLAAKQHDRLRRAAVARAMADLPERQRQVFAARWLRQPPATLQQIASELRVSSERVRQIEAQAMGNIRRSVAKDTRLNKRTPGAPLSEAELQQRRDAARARWAAAGVGTAVGAAAAHFAVPHFARIKAAKVVAEDAKAPSRALRLAALRREVRLGRIDATEAARYRQAGKAFNKRPDDETAPLGPVTRRVRRLRSVLATSGRKMSALDARIKEIDDAFKRGEVPKPGMGERAALRAKQDLAEELTRAKAELDQLLGETPATRAVRGAYRNMAGRYANLAIEPLARLERYRRTVPSSVSPDDMKRIRALVRAHGASQATNARNFVMDTWQRAIPGITAKLSERSKQSLARVVRGKWRLPALAAGAALGAGAGAWAGHRLSKLTPAQISAAAGQAKPPRSLAEAEAGTYRKGHITLHGMQIAIETPKGVDRLGFAKDGTIKWRARMPAHYGYVKGSMGADGDHVDVYLGPRAHDPDCPVFVVDQHRLDGAFDEHKAVLGCADEAAALRIYDAGFADGSGPKRRRGVTQMSVAAFRAKVMAGKMAEPLAKVAPDDGTWRQPDLFEDQLTTPSAASEEKALASRLARMFRSWMDNPGRVGNAGDIAEALDPLYGILRSGAQSVPPPPDAGDSLAGMPESRELGVSFDLRSEEVERRLREYALDRIRAITQESRDAIRATLIEAAQSGLPIDEQARRIREAVGLSPGQQNWVTSYRAQLEVLDPRALDRALRDRRHDGPIRSAIQSNTPLAAEDIERYVASYQRRTLAYRAMTIARTEALRGANTGMVEGARGMLADFPDVEVEKVWIATKDRRTRDAHAELDGKRVIGLDMPFQIRDPKTGAVEQIRWPHDPQASAGMVVNCRCTFGIRLIPKPGAGRFIADAA